MSGGKFLLSPDTDVSLRTRAGKAGSSLFSDLSQQPRGRQLEMVCKIFSILCIGEKICRNDITAMHIKIQPARLSVALATKEAEQNRLRRLCFVG